MGYVLEGIRVEELIGIVEDLISLSQYTRIKGLYECQKEALHEIFRRYFSRRYVSGIIQMPTGTGKTILAASIILALWKYYSIVGKKRLLAIFLAPRIVIRRQTLEKFNELLFYGSQRSIDVVEVDSSESFCNELFSFLNSKPTINQRRQIELVEKIPTLRKKYYKYLARMMSDKTKGLVIIATPQLIHNLFRSKINNIVCIKALMNNLDILIMDEIHTFYTGEQVINTMNEIMKQRKIPIIIGLTATPIREAISLLGGVIYNKFSCDAMREGILTPGIKLITYKTFIYNLRPLTSDTDKEKNEWRYAIKERAIKYAGVIIKELRKIRDEAGLSRYPKTLVVATNTTEADLLAREIEKLVNNETKVLIAHYKVKDDPHDIIEEFKKYDSGILITVNMADIGFDDPDLEVLVLARPITNAIAYVQLRGRVLRKPKSRDNLKALRKYAVIIDLVGRKNLLQIEKIYVKKVELGTFMKNNLESAMKELRGADIVPIAKADVIVKQGSEAIIGELPESDKMSKIEETSTSESRLEQLIKILEDIYKVELDHRRKELSICRSTKYTNDCRIILLKSVLQLSGSNDLNKEKNSNNY